MGIPTIIANGFTEAERERICRTLDKQLEVLIEDSPTEDPELIEIFPMLSMEDYRRINRSLDKQLVLIEDSPITEPEIVEITMNNIEKSWGCGWIDLKKPDLCRLSSPKWANFPRKVRQRTRNR